MSDLRATLAVLAIFSGLACITQLSSRSPEIQSVTIQDWNAQAPQQGAKPEYALVEVYPTATVLLNGKPTDLRKLHSSILSLEMRYPMVLIHPASDAPYSVLLRTIKAIKAAGVSPSRICLDNIEPFRQYEREPYSEPYPPELPPDKVGSGDEGDHFPGDCNTLTYPDPLY